MSETLKQVEEELKTRYGWSLSEREKYLLELGFAEGIKYGVEKAEE